MSNTKLWLRGRLGVYSFVATASVGFVLGACNEEQEDPDTIEVSGDIVDACTGYCENLAKCNEETVQSECEKKCKGALYACEEHEAGEALDQVEQCGGEDCLALPLCTANAGVQCVTGLGL